MKVFKLEKLKILDVSYSSLFDCFYIGLSYYLVLMVIL